MSALKIESLELDLKIGIVEGAKRFIILNGFYIVNLTRISLAVELQLLKTWLQIQQSVTIGLNPKHMRTIREA